MKILTSILTLAMLSLTVLAADGPIRHVVHFKFKADADNALVAKVVTEFAALKGKIAAIEALEYGTNVSPEKHDKGFTHCWIATFKNAAARDAYLVHPDHQAFVALLKPVLEDALVIDFVVQK
jgi:Stress responsive A/B Barrel Domain